MNPKQRILVSQLQIAGAGLIIGGFGLFAGPFILFWVGLEIVVLALVRLVLFGKFFDFEEITEKDIAEYNESLQNDDDDESDW